jgi:uncharacterized protein (DUF488 family)
LIKTLFTIGYTGLQLDAFIEQLESAKIDLLLDIREIPISRKRGFSKTALAGILLASGIKYQHLKWLGSPKSLRHEVRETRDYDKFFRGVVRHLRQDSSVVQLKEAIDLARQVRCCLMCCCEDWKFCHRSCVVDEMLTTNHFKVLHLPASAIEKTKRKSA